MKTLKLLILISYIILTNTTPKCDFSMHSININANIIKSNISLEFEGVLYPRGTYITFKYNGKIHFRGCICLVRNCFKVCSSREFAIDGNFSRVITITNCNYLYSSTYNLTEIKYTAEDSQLNITAMKTEINEYCSLKLKSEQYYFIIIYHIVEGICLTTTIVFSAAILAAFALISELRSLNGKLIMCYVLAVLFTHLNEVIAYNIHATNFLRYIAFSNFFGHMFVLFWSNAICFDVWSAYRIHGKDSDSNNKFILYAFYATGGSAFMLLLSKVIDFSKISSIVGKW